MTHYEAQNEQYLKEQNEPVKQSKLRLDFFLGLGLDLSNGDVCKGRDPTIITSFSPRKNTGVQPDCGDVPIIARYNETRTRSDLKSKLSFKFIDAPCVLNMESWQPDLNALIKMQDEHDAKQDEASENLLQAVADSYPVKGTEPNFKGVDKPFELNLDGAIKNAAKAFEKTKEVDMKEQLKFTREIALTQGVMQLS